MESLGKPTHIVELDLQKLTRQLLLLTGISFVLLRVCHLLINGFERYTFSIGAIVWDIFLLSVGYLLLIVLHEFFHLLGFRLFSRVPWRKMKVGVDLKLGIAYATTDQLMVNRAIRKSLLLPFWMTGILPAVIGLFTGNTLLLTLAALLIGGAAGDFSMYRQLKKFPDDWLIQDHPSEPKLYVFDPDAEE